MATKRAHIAATLNSTAASDIFTQDLEDIPGADDDIPPSATDKEREPENKAKSESKPVPETPKEEHEMLKEGDLIPKWYWNIPKEVRAKYIPEGYQIKKVEDGFRCIPIVQR